MLKILPNGKERDGDFQSANTLFSSYFIGV